MTNPQNERTEPLPPPRPRPYRPDLAHLPLEWVPGDRQTTHTIDVLSLLLPEGEAWFVDVFRETLPLLEGHPVQAAVRGFMGQEAIHGRAHSRVIEHLARHGIDSAAFTDRLRDLFRTIGSDHPLGRPLSPHASRAWLVQRVGIIAAIEQLTSMLGDWVLAHDALDRVGADPGMMQLLRWHGAEEVEHRTVAFEAFEALGGRYPGRALGMVIAAPLLIGYWVAGTVDLMGQAERVTGEKRPAGVGEFVRAGREGLLPTATCVLSGIARYFRPRHDPRDEGDDRRARDYLTRIPSRSDR